MSDRPAFRDLPVRDGLPPRSAWGVFGDDDEVGALNLVTPDLVRRAAGLVTAGRVFPLAWRLELPSPPLFGRQAARHTIIDLDPVGTDDRYDSFYPQASSQWDALSHIEHPVHGFYNGFARADITGEVGSRIGIDRWASRGIVGRFVLADLANDRIRRGLSVDYAAKDAFIVDEVEGCLRAEGVVLGEGDILLLRFGWVPWYEGTDQPTREALASTDFFPAPGLAQDVRTAEWLWDAGVVAVIGDNPAVEAQPFDESSEDGFLHYRLVPLLGMAIGELFDLEALARDCAADGRYEGLFVAAPLNKTGGSGSPANAVALK